MKKAKEVSIENKKTIEAIKIPNKRNLYGRTKNINPYTTINLYNKKILIEIPIEYAKQHEGEYYYLYKDLTPEEKAFFIEYIYNLEYDYLYKLEKSNQKNTKSAYQI